MFSATTIATKNNNDPSGSSFHRYYLDTAAAAAAAGLTETVLPSPSSSGTTYDDETSAASIQPTTLRRASSSLCPIDNSSVVWSSDLHVPTSLSHLLSNLLLWEMGIEFFGPAWQYQLWLEFRSSADQLESPTTDLRFPRVLWLLQVVCSYQRLYKFT